MGNRASSSYNFATDDDGQLWDGDVQSAGRHNSGSPGRHNDSDLYDNGWPKLQLHDAGQSIHDDSFAN